MKDVRQVEQWLQISEIDYVHLMCKWSKNIKDGDWDVFPLLRIWFS